MKTYCKRHMIKMVYDNLNWMTQHTSQNTCSVINISSVQPIKLLGLNHKKSKILEFFLIGNPYKSVFIPMKILKFKHARTIDCIFVCLCIFNS